MLGAGFDNTAWLVNGALVFRFPRRWLGATLMETEIRVLPQLAGRLAVPVPDPRWVGRPASGYPCWFAGYRRLAGRCADAARLSVEQRHGLAAPLGRFLRVLHGTPPPTGLGPDPMRRLDAEHRIPAALEHLEQWGHLVEREPLRALLLEPFDPGAGPLGLLHGDLYSRHLLVEDGALSGVLDWGDVHVGPPSVDLSLPLTLLPPEALPEFLDAYGPVDEATWRSARFRAVTHGLNVLRYAAAIGDADLLDETRLGLGYLVRGAV